MSGQCTGWVLREGPKDRALRLVLLTIADAANRDGDHARPGIGAIVEGALYSEGHVRRALTVLENEGWIVRTERPGPGKVAEYAVLMGRDAASVIAAHHARRPDAPKSGNTAQTPRVHRANAAHPDARRSETDTSFKELRTTDNVQPLFPPHDLFDEFWEQYGHKIDKGTARRAWKAAIKKAPPEKIIDAAFQYRLHRNPAYVKNPATWLNAESWDNDTRKPHTAPSRKDAAFARIAASIQHGPRAIDTQEASQ